MVPRKTDETDRVAGLALKGIHCGQIGILPAVFLVASGAGNRVTGGRLSVPEEDICQNTPYRTVGIAAALLDTRSDLRELFPGYPVGGTAVLSKYMTSEAELSVVPLAL